MKSNFVAVAAIGTAALLTVTACSSSKGGGGSQSKTTATVSAACAPYKDYLGHSGKTVTMFGSILSPESDSLNKSWAAFEKCTGIKISYTGSNDFESQLPVQVQGGSAPNLAIIPQPGLLAQMVKTGQVKAPPAGTVANEANWNAAWKSYGSVNGTFYAAPMSANMKSLVWYSPKLFAAKGYTIPTTWAQLMSLSAKIAADGVKPWCGGIGSGTATGWPATDWVEEAVLGTYGGQVYDDWISHKVKFTDPKIEAAMKTVASYMQNPAWVNGGIGGVKSIATTTFQDAGVPITKGTCGMLQQASFYEAQWPKGTTVSPTGDVFAFYLPAVNSSISTPVEGGGEFVTAFSSDPATQAVQNYLSSPEWADSRIKVAPGWVSANEKVDQSLYTDPIDKISAKYLADSSATFRFDASDAMPAAVGSGAEWKAMTEWFGSGKSIDAVAKEIDAAWPN
ncbi:ABC transporter substrate-binding protein [Jatrophihabitans sp.]|uniref:ABC transporter substrate-binding protein n=1 Tax=Jatrophihabitans sp. TaxID=1932789 RepID=UPI0030C765B7|nr:sugar transporter substrate-binding protein [Jatrophihabitans sp.]